MYEVVSQLLKYSAVRNNLPARMQCLYTVLLSLDLQFQPEILSFKVIYEFLQPFSKICHAFSQDYIHLSQSASFPVFL